MPKEHTNFSLNIEVENLDRFIDFLDKNLKCPYNCYDLDACFEDLEKVVGTQLAGFETSDKSIVWNYSYELNSYETESHRPELIDFQIETVYYGENGELLNPLTDDVESALEIKEKYIF